MARWCRQEPHYGYNFRYCLQNGVAMNVKFRNLEKTYIRVLRSMTPASARRPGERNTPVRMSVRSRAD